MLVHMFKDSATLCRTLLPALRWNDAMTTDADDVTCRACQRVMAVEVERALEEPQWRTVDYAKGVYP